MRRRFDPVAAWLKEATGPTFRFDYGASYDDVVASLAAGRVAFAALPSYAYVLAAERIPGLRLFVTEVADGWTHYQGYVVGSRRAGIRRLSDLMDRPFAFTDPGSASGHLFPRYLLHEAGIEPERDFSEIVGVIATDFKKEYTAIGHTVNLASRIEGLTRDLGHPLLADEATARAVSSLHDVGCHAVRGLASEVRLFTVNDAG